MRIMHDVQEVYYTTRWECRAFNVDRALQGLKVQGISVTWPMSDTLRMEAAMCLWEAALDDRQRRPDGLATFWEDNGTVEVRHALMDAVEALHLGWSIYAHHGADYLSFDWEFVPLFYQHCLGFDVHGVYLKKGWFDMCASGFAK